MEVAYTDLILIPSIHLPRHTQMVNMGVMATITQSIDAETAVKVRLHTYTCLYHCITNVCLYYVIQCAHIFIHLPIHTSSIHPSHQLHQHMNTQN